MDAIGLIVEEEEDVESVDEVGDDNGLSRGELLLSRGDGEDASGSAKRRTEMGTD